MKEIVGALHGFRHRLCWYSGFVPFPRRLLAAKIKLVVVVEVIVRRIVLRTVTFDYWKKSPMSNFLRTNVKLAIYRKRSEQYSLVVYTAVVLNVVQMDHLWPT